MFGKHVLDEGLVSRMYEELSQLDSKNNNNEKKILKWAKDLKSVLLRR